MANRFSFEIKITGILIVILSLVALTGVFAYQRFAGVVYKISDSVRPDMRLLTAKALINEINDAEISVKSYRISEDTIYLDAFFHAVERIENEIDLLHSLTVENQANNNDQDLIKLDSLIDQKIRVLNDLLYLQDGFRTEQALNKVTTVLENSIIEDTIDDLPQEDKRRFDWLFKSKYKERVHKDTLLSINELNKEVQDIKWEERRFQKAFRARELELILKDQDLSSQIELFFETLESIELEKIETDTKEAEIAIQQTNQQIALFCIVTGVLVLFMAFIIINYVRNNNNYRKALKLAKEEAEDLARIKQKFIDNMSHEIRTPMNAIAGFSEQIGLGPLTQVQRNQLDMVQKSTDHLLYLINDVLDLSKLQAEKIKLEEIPFDPKSLLEDVTRFFENEANKKQLFLRFEVLNSIPETLLGDPYRFRQIILNLVGNALKFTSKGGVKISVKSKMNNNSYCLLEITIADTGIGIDKSNLSKIFNEFEQAEVSTTRNYGGSGLGLSIVKQLVGLHQGKIGIRSELNEGTTIVLELPYKIIATKANNTHEQTTGFEQNLFKELKILIVDDENFNRLLIISILKKFGVKYTEATNGEEALDEIDKNEYDLVLMDVRMPKLDGCQATEIIRKKSDPKKRQLPIIALTAAVSSQHLEHYKSIGINHVLAKPFKENDLLSVIVEVLDLSAENIKNSSIEMTEKNERINLNDLKQLSGADPVFYLDMLKTFVLSTENGIQEIRARIETNDWQAIADQAHKISSPCKHLGANELYQLLKQIENNSRENQQYEKMLDLIEAMEKEGKLVIKEVKNEINKLK